MGRVWSSQNSCTSTLNAEAWCGWAHHPGCSHNRDRRIGADNDCIVLPYRHCCGKVSITGKTNRWWSGGGNDHRKPVRPARNDAQTTRYHFPYCTQPKRFTSMCKQMYNMLQLVCGMMAYFTVLEYRNRCLSASVCLSVYVLMCIQPTPLPLRNSDLPSRKNTCAVLVVECCVCLCVSVAAACKTHQKSDCTLRTKSVNECAPNTNNTTHANIIVYISMTQIYEYTTRGSAMLGGFRCTRCARFEYTFFHIFSGIGIGGGVQRIVI